MVVANPDARVVHVDNDPMVLLYQHVCLGSTAEGRTTYLDADMRDTDHILVRAPEDLDFTKPVALVLSDLLGHVHDDATPSYTTSSATQPQAAPSSSATPPPARACPPRPTSTRNRADSATTCETCRESYGPQDHSPEAVWRARIPEARHLGAIRLERRRLAKPDAVVESHEALSAVLAGLS
ncbi:SAM-dependent methyltransferase [Streptomyces sp. NPDC127108]|uniref:SAM-dependent methyltransferase n=1 Tax=Streptomyces sp. NPDC127108 TaxID=3345361 RepID=UPI0036400CD8